MMCVNVTEGLCLSARGGGFSEEGEHGLGEKQLQRGGSKAGRCSDTRASPDAVVLTRGTEKGGVLRAGGRRPAKGDGNGTASLPWAFT